MPPGICTVAKRASKPFNAELSKGTPITGRIELAAMTPARWAAPPAPTISTSNPRSSAVVASLWARSGERCAEATAISQAMPSSATSVSFKTTGRMPVFVQLLAKMSAKDEAMMARKP